MRLQSFAAVLLTSLLLGAAQVLAAAAYDPAHELAGPAGALLDRRGVIEDIVSILRSKKSVGSNFCSTFLHLPPYAATRTVTTTRTVAKTVPASTATSFARVTSTASAATVRKTTTLRVAFTPTSQLTISTAVPVTSTVATLTNPIEVTSTVTTITVTSLTPEARDVSRTTTLAHDLSRTRLPYWLNQYSCPQVSRACPQIVTPRTTTVTKTASATAIRTVKAGAATVVVTRTIAVTPTTTLWRTVRSTSTASALTSTKLVPSTTVVDVTATVDSTATIEATATETVYAPIGPQCRLRINKVSDGSYVGHVQTNVGYAKNTDTALLLQDPTAAPGGVVAPFNLRITSPQATYPYLGVATGQQDGADLATTGYGFVQMVSANAVPAGARSKNGEDSLWEWQSEPEAHETQVWSIDPSTNVLSMTWTNSDGTSVTPQAIVFAGGVVGFSSNPSAVATLTANLFVVHHFIHDRCGK
ncbi:hypothetical protein V8E36_005122 [Tilletia maclaganii]